MHRPARSPIRRAHIRSTLVGQRESSWRFDVALRWASSTLAVFSLVGVVLSAMGFGFAFALTRFGLDIFEILHGPSDYLAAASLVVGVLLTLLMQIFRDLSWWWTVVVMMGIAAGVWIVVGVVLALSVKAQAVAMRTQAVIARASQWLRTRSAWVQAAVFSLCGIAATFAALAMLWAMSAFLCSLIALLTALGDSVATRYLYEAVVEPMDCVDTLNASERRSRHLSPPKVAGPPYGAMCLQVEAKGFQPIRGRRVVATSEVIVLFDPDTGIVRTVPRKDAVVTTLSRL